MSIWKVLVLDGLNISGIEVLKRSPSFHVDEFKKLSNEELLSKIPEYDALIVRSATKVNKELLGSAEKLKIIGRAGIGVDNIDVAEATKRGIIVMNTPSENTTTTAEHAISLLFSMAKNIPQAYMSMKRGLWEKSKFMGVEVENKVIGIIGLGNIGKIVSLKAAALGMRVLAYDPYLTEEKAKHFKARLVDMDTLLKEASFITIHTPLTDSTKGMINKEAFSKMQKGVYLINAARGSIVNESDLIEAIEQKIVAGAALDVLEKEPLDSDHPLRKISEVVMTPHIGAATREAQRNVAMGIAMQFVDYVEKGLLKNAVNLPSIPSELMSLLEPYREVASKMGELGGQLWEGPVRRVKLEYKGELADLPIQMLTNEFLKTFLSFMLGEKVNEVSAPFLARERGIEVVESSSLESPDYTSVISVHVYENSNELTIDGCVFGKRNPKIVRVGEFPLELSPYGFVLFLENKDVPGVVGKIGSELGKEGINIAGLMLGREEIGGRAYSLYHIDNDLGPNLLEKIRHMPDIIAAKVIRFKS